MPRYGRSADQNADRAPNAGVTTSGLSGGSEATMTDTTAAGRSDLALQVVRIRQDNAGELPVLVVADLS
jgi:hypothetical protein